MEKDEKDSFGFSDFKFVPQSGSHLQLDKEVNKESGRPSEEIEDNCPRCGFDGFHHDISDPFEEVFLCRLCGYLKTIVTLKDATSRKNPRPRLGGNGKPLKKRTSVIKTYGAYRFGFKKDKESKCLGKWGAVLGKFGDEEAISWFNDVLKQNPHINRRATYLTKWDEQNHKVVYLVGSPEWIGEISK